MRSYCEICETTWRLTVQKMRRTGHIRERSPGSFELRYSLGTDPATGKRKIATTTVKGSLKEAGRELRRLQRAVDTGEAIEPGKLTTAAWLQQWLRMVRPEISPLTYRLYEVTVRLYLTPAFGHVPLSRLSAAHIQMAYSDLAESGRRNGKRSRPLATSSRRLIHRVLVASLNRAQELQLVGRNPAAVLRRRLPKVERRPMTILSPEQTLQVLEAACGTELYIPVLLALATGARRGEISALRWRSIDLKRSEILIADSARVLTGGEIKLGPTKGGRNRRVSLPSLAVEELSAWRRGQAEQLLRVGVRQSGDTRVCSRPDGTAISPNRLTSSFKRLAERLGLAVTFHSLRHTHATQLLVAGAHPRTMQERLGHASVALTLDIYSHVTDQLRDDAAEKIDSVLRGR